MAAIRFTSAILLKEILQSPHCAPRRTLFSVLPSFRASDRRCISYSPVRCASTPMGTRAKKAFKRIPQLQLFLTEADERDSVAHNEPTPKITLGQVNLSFAKSGGGGSANKQSAKVDMRFNVKKATWLSERVRERILVMEKKKINKDGELVISSTKTRTQQYLVDVMGNIQDALSKMQAIIDAASYVSPPLTEELRMKVAAIAAISEQKRLHGEKALHGMKASSEEVEIAGTKREALHGMKASSEEVEIAGTKCEALHGMKASSEEVEIAGTKREALHGMKASSEEVEIAGTKREA